MPARFVTRLILGVSTCVLGAASPSAAQSADPPRLSISAAGGVAVPHHGDFDFTAGEWQAAVRTAPGRHVLLEFFFDEWRHTGDERFGPGTITDRNGLIVRFSEFTRSTQHRTRTVGFNVLARGALDRVTVTAGGGPGYIAYQRTSTSSFAGCQPAQSGTCEGSQTRHDSSSFSLQAVGGLEVAITDRIAAFGQYQFTGVVEDIGFSHSSVTGGVRVRVW